MRSRLKSEVLQTKKPYREAYEVEDSLLRLAQLQKNKISLDEFSSRDKYHLLDLFVNSDKTLLKVYEALFPPDQKTVY